MNEYFALSLSAVAVLISIYGVFERQRASFNALRVRLTELLETIEELNIDEGQYAENSASHDENDDLTGIASYAFASRRALLTYQALNLIDKLHKSRFARSDEVTASEYGSLAYSLGTCGDWWSARRLWERAVAVARNSFVPSIVRAANLRGLAMTLMELKEVELARRTFTECVSVETGGTPTELRNSFETHMQWLWYEQQLSDHARPELPIRGAYEIAATPGPWGPSYLQRLREAALSTVYVKSLGEYREVTADDLLKLSMEQILEGATI